jgi:ATP-binding cassette subfamily F protein 3
LDDVTVGYDGVAVLSGIDLVVERGQKLSLVGPNGAGKSTLLKVMLGDLEPMSGTATVGHQVDIAYFAQHQVEALDLENTVVQEFTMRVGVDNLRERNPRSVLGSFGFSGDAADRVVHDLSGGERTRLALAICMANPVNLLVLDEPTNHLDLPSCDLLEDALGAYPGTVLLVSHDRHLIRSVAHDLVEVRDGAVRVHHGVEESVLSPSFEGGRAAPDAPKATPTATPARPAATRSENKRRNAEQRQRRSGATKQLAAEVGRIEKALARAEVEVADLNRSMADPDVFGDPDAVSDLSRRFGEAKDRSVRLMEEWEAASLRLEEARNNAI